MPTTTNFGWTTPADTDLVKDGAAAIRTLAGNIDTSLVDLKGGTTGQVLAKASNTDLDFTWSADAGIPATIVDAKGDLIVASGADAVARLAVGTNDYILTADSAATNGIKWAAAPAASGPAFYANSATDQNISQNTWTKLTFGTEQFDTDSCFASSTFTPNKAGYYQVNAGAYFQPDPIDTSTFLGIYVNGTRYQYMSVKRKTQSSEQFMGTSLVYLNGTTDYIEIYALMGAATTRNIQSDEKATNFSAIWIRS